MKIPNLRPCLFCTGKYEELIKPEGMDDFVITTVFMNKIGTEKLIIPKSVAVRCSTCGNIQTFVEQEIQV